jgi:hypothetical protein
MSDGSRQDGDGAPGKAGVGQGGGEADGEAVSLSRVHVAGSLGSLDIHI